MQVQEATETAAMASGKELHRVLEAEVKKEEVDVELETSEDAWALRLLSCIQCLRQLMKDGLTREVYLFGHLQVTPDVQLGSHCAVHQLPGTWLQSLTESVMASAVPCMATE